MDKRDWATAVLCAALILVQVYLDLRIPEYMNDITLAISNGDSTDTVFGYGKDMVFCALASLCISLGASLFAAMTAASLCRSLRIKMFDKVGSFSPEDISLFSVDSLITRSTNDIAQIQNFIAQGLQVVVKTPVLTVWAVCKISGAEWQWTLATITGITMLTLIIGLILYYTYPKYKRVPVITDRINKSAMEHLTGLRVVRAFNAEHYQEEKFADASIEMMDNCIYIWKRSSLLPATSSGMGNFLTLAIYWTGMVLISQTSDHAAQTIMFSNMIVFSSYTIQVLNSFMSLAFLFQISPRALASSKRIQEVIRHEPSIQDGTYDGPGDDPGSVEFENVSFSYPGTDRKVLHGISFSLRRGETLAIIGATGSGKTTLVKLILRFYRAGSGTVRVNGMDVNDYRLDRLNSEISYVAQSNTVFSGTIESNVNYGSTSSDRTSDDIQEALDIAQASEFVGDLPEKEGTAVTENGKNLSGGQRQRIGIARAVCKKADICILDDPFSALDFRTDLMLRRALSRSYGESTKIIVSQRVGTVMECDRIMVLDEGRIIGLGTHEELLKTCPKYLDLAVSQMEVPS